MKKILNCFLLVVCSLISACVSISEPDYHAQVIANAHEDMHGKVFYSLQSAIDAAPEAAGSPYKIYIGPGDYYEKITIAKPNIQLIGAGIDKTRLYFDAYAGQEYESGKTWGTRGSGTVIVRAADIQFHNLTIENSFDFLANDALQNDDPKKIRESQAVALYLEDGSDRVLVRNVKLLGYQDTLFVNAGRSWFDKTLVAGNVDYIFGAGNALFTNSEIVTRIRGKQNSPHGYVTAPSTKIASQYGLTFIDCRLTREAGVPDNSTPLGRPWKPTTQFADGRYGDPNAIGKAVFINTLMDAHITVDGWYSMGATARDGTKIPVLPESARFFEYRSKGAGAAINDKRRQLTDREARQYTRQKILGEWQTE